MLKAVVRRLLARCKLAAFALAMFVILLFGLASPLTAAGISKAEKAAFLKLAGELPADTSYSVLLTNISHSLLSMDAILQKYQQSDPTFKYHQVILSLKGSLGYNPFKIDELKSMGLDIDAGIFAFSKSQEGVPLIGFRALDVTKAAESLGQLALNMGGFKPCTPIEQNGVTLHYYTVSGDLNTAIGMAFAVKGDRFYAMFTPPAKQWFEQQLESALKVKKGGSLAGDRGFKKLLGRLDTGSAFLMYNDYKQYAKELRKGADKLKSQFGQQLQVNQLGSYVPLMDEMIMLAESFTAQIFAVSINERRIGFIHEIIGPKKAVARFRKFFNVKGGVSFSKLKLAANPIGVLVGHMNLTAVYNHLTQKKPDSKKSFDHWNDLLHKEAGIDFVKDVMGNLDGKIAALFYGFRPLPSEISKADSVTQAQLAGLANLVILAGLKNPAQTEKVLKKAEAAIRASGKTVELIKHPGFNVLYSVDSDGLPIQYGVYGKLFVLGIGGQAIQTATSGTLGLKLGFEKGTVSRLSMDFKRFAASMENLAPPADSPNTQLFQQYNLWKQQFAPKIGFLDKVEMKVILIPDGLHSSGEVTF